MSSREIEKPESRVAEGAVFGKEEWRALPLRYIVNDINAGGVLATTEQARMNKHAYGIECDLGIPFDTAPTLFLAQMYGRGFLAPLVSQIINQQMFDLIPRQAFFSAGVRFYLRFIFPPKYLPNTVRWRNIAVGDIEG